ncbi:MAG: TetR/AcrR family transcriptional regulator [Phycisphaerales bacterium]
MGHAGELRPVHELFGQPPPASTGRERLIAAGVDLFARFGFHAVGLDRVIEQAGVTKTTFYKHFESKDELILACIEWRHAWETAAWERAVEKVAGDDPRAQLIGFFDVMDLWFNDPDFRGCVFLNTAAEFADRRDPIHQAAAAHKKANRDIFRDLAARAGASDPEGFADAYTILLEGTLILRHVHGRNDAARVTKPAVVDLIQRSMPGGAVGSADAAAGTG